MERCDMTSATILADSTGPHGVRLTTFELTFPRFILAELNTHRMLSRNSASSRAIPTEKRIEEVVLNPFVPEFGARVKGMGVGATLEGAEQAAAQDEWLRASRDAVRAARQLLRVDKSRANRLLEPFLWQTAIVSGTDWDNFFALRTHPAAQPEFRALALEMQRVHRIYEPVQLEWGEWHLPLVGIDGRANARQLGKSLTKSGLDPRVDHEFYARVSAGRCARVSYDVHSSAESLDESAARWDSLAENGHWSPAEHPARVPTEEEWADRLNWHEGRWGNFRGWVQLRKHYDNEEVFDG